MAKSKAPTAKSYQAQDSLNALMGQKRTQTASLKGGTTLGTTLHPYDGMMQDSEAGYETGTSIFDPTLCELIYRWFSPPGGVILDSFAGGSVRGIVASKLGRRYIGVDLSARQIAANRQQAETICADDPYHPEWRVGDSTLMDEIAPDVEADMVFSCPPYGSLERYSDDPRDLSTMDYPQFREMYSQVIAAACRRLRMNRFACFVVGDFRDKEGYYNNFPGHTIEAFQSAGLRLYNSAILVTATGSLPVRAGRAFSASRKLGRTHQECLFFVKGSWQLATQACGELDV